MSIIAEDFPRDDRDLFAMPNPSQKIPGHPLILAREQRCEPYLHAVLTQLTEKAGWRLLQVSAILTACSSSG
jgi:hypothetical protein